MKLIKNIFSKQIKIYYICQYMQGYNKFCDVIHAMQQDPCINIKVLAFPEDISQFPKNTNLPFWKEKFGDIVINAVTEQGWFDLQKEKPDYVFVQRPYNNYLPSAYSTENIAKFTKLCYIPYGFNLLNIRDVSLNRSFLKDLYFFFAENTYEYNYVKKIMKEYGCGHYSIDLGYPALETELQNYFSHYSAFDQIPSQELKVIWTPRWSYDQALVKTTFFDYKEQMIQFFHKHQKMQLVFRPHPLAFQNFIAEGLMQKKEVTSFLKQFQYPNMFYDTASEYFQTFMDSDCLITDYSSIIIDYLILGKPIIMCTQDKHLFSELMHKIDKVCYQAKSFNDIENILKDLSCGKDPLKEKRKQLTSQLFKKNYIHTSKQIVECIKEDFFHH